MQHLDITVRGKVQGVFFRASTKEKADELGIRGTVANQADGSVRVRAEGEPEALDALLDWLHQGPPQARVDEVSQREGSPRHYPDFSVT